MWYKSTFVFLLSATQATCGVIIQPMLDYCNGIKMELNRHFSSGNAEYRPHLSPRQNPQIWLCLHFKETLNHRSCFAHANIVAWLLQARSCRTGVCIVHPNSWNWEATIFKTMLTMEVTVVCIAVFVGVSVGGMQCSYSTMCTLLNYSFFFLSFPTLSISKVT